ncbi:hypothetical protein F2Q70_00035091 [Brassica cretica]|uniref:Uncharacterized protein n=1 Tax=Brassica cretica TaxID=69181 RepID=A0A8S9JRB8_BRACR|nr:hypothetical protein F2Q70_00035091 [Brassica cretica]
MRNVNNTVDTVNAAASAIVSAESRVQPLSVQKRKWGSWWSLYWCFGSQKNNKRIGHAVLVPEPVASGSAPVAPVQTSSSNSTSIFLPFIAPPSSPASFLQSGPSSVSHTPHGVVNAYSRNEPPSAFAIGPYANETQPVTPPVDSAVTTAPYTPPPESGRASCATPSSPEVPFAQLLTSSLERARRNGCGGVSQKFSAGHYEFKSHQVYPGSPGGTVAHRVSFELTGEDVARCFASKLYGVGLDEKSNKWSDSVSGNELSEKLRTFSLGSSKEFKFDNTKEEVIEKTAEWWANEKVAGKGDNSPGNSSWSFFPVLRSGGFS